MEVSGRTKQNYMRVIGALFRFGSARRYLPKDAIEEVEAVQQAKADNSEIEIFTPAEFAEILNTARAEMVPWLATGALRPGCPPLSASPTMARTVPTRYSLSIIGPWISTREGSSF
jgi:hypothetical protein